MRSGNTGRRVCASMSMRARAVSGTANGNDQSAPRQTREHALLHCRRVAGGGPGCDRVGAWVGVLAGAWRWRLLLEARAQPPAREQRSRRRASSSASTGRSFVSRCRRASTPCCCRSARSSRTASPPTAPTSSRRSPSPARWRRASTRCRTGRALRLHRLDGRVPRRLHRARVGLSRVRPRGAPRPREEPVSQHHPDQRSRRRTDRAAERARRRGRPRGPRAPAGRQLVVVSAPTSRCRCSARTAGTPATTRPRSCSRSIRRWCTRSATPVPR